MKTFKQLRKEKKLQKIQQLQNYIKSLTDEQFDVEIENIRYKQKVCDRISIASFMPGMVLVIGSFFLPVGGMAMLLVAAGLISISCVGNFTYERFEKKATKLKKNKEFIKAQEMVAKKAYSFDYDRNEGITPTIECVTSEDGVTNPNDCGFEV